MNKEKNSDLLRITSMWYKPPLIHKLKVTEDSIQGHSTIPSQSLIQNLTVQDGDPQKTHQKRALEQSLTKNYGYLDDRLPWLIGNTKIHIDTSCQSLMRMTEKNKKKAQTSSELGKTKTWYINLLRPLTEFPLFPCWKCFRLLFHLVATSSRSGLRWVRRKKDAIEGGASGMRGTETFRLPAGSHFVGLGPWGLGEIPKWWWNSSSN